MRAVARRVRLVGHAARPGLPPRERHPGRPRHRRERRPDGVRQQGRPLGNRRRLHAEPVDGREGDLRRVPRERPGRGRRRGDPHAAAGRGARARDARGLQAAARHAPPRSRSTTATCRTPSSPSRTATLYMLQTRAAKRTAAAALKAAVDMVDEGLISRDEAVRGSTPRSSTSCCTRASTRTSAPEPVAKGLNASPGAACGGIVFDADTAGREGEGRAGDPRPVRDDARRHPRDDRRAGHPHRPRRHDLARGGRGAGDGEAVRRGLRGARRSRAALATIGGTELREGDVITIDGGTGAVYVGAVELVPPSAERGLPDGPRLGRRRAPPARPRERRHAARRRPGARVRGRRGSASAAPSTCSSARSGCR